MKINSKIFLIILSVAFIYGCTKDVDIRNLDISKLGYKLPNYTYLCMPTKKERCPANGAACEEITPYVFWAYDQTKGIIYRCGNKCTAYKDKDNKGYLSPDDTEGLFMFSILGETFEEHWYAGMGYGFNTYGTCSKK